MIVWFASLQPCPDDSSFDRASDEALLIERKGDAVRFGVESAGGLTTLSILRATMLWVEKSGVNPDAMLVWAFSSVAIPVVELGMLLERWDATGEPPVLSIIALMPGGERHATRGMAGLVGYELVAQFAGPAQSRDAARNLARLARHAMVNGRLDRNVVYEGIDGHPLLLDWAERHGATTVVTIVLQSIRNGHGLD